jgi:hypothetical protein
MKRYHDIMELGSHEDNVRGFHRHFRTGPDRDPNIALCQCYRVVYPIAHHGDAIVGLLIAPALHSPLLQAPDQVCLTLWFDVGTDIIFVDTYLSSDGLSC